MQRTAGAFFASLLIVGLVVVSIGITPEDAHSRPVGDSEERYQLFGRIWPDPHGCENGIPPFSPWAKGTACSTDFIQLNKMKTGLTFLEKLYPKFVKHFVLGKHFRCSGKPERPKFREQDKCGAFRSAGLPVTVDENGEGFVRERRHLRMVRITDERVPNKDKKFFVFPLSIHGIERAGIEGGLRAAEDLATWGACQADLAPDFVDCEGEITGSGSKPYPILEATPGKSIGARKALRKTVIYFIAPNPDGWLRGDRTRNLVPNTPPFYQRYNGNGVDLNRDWPAKGYTFRPYTPWSEPESRSFGKVLKKIGPRDKKGRPKWTGGIDLHGQLIDRAFSFTLMGGSERPFGKNQRMLQVVKGAWRDAEERLGYSPAIKPNDAPPQPEDPRVYGVQWGTIWDTIDYTVTGALGDWIDSPMGLNANGIDNEMSMSHLSNCGIGTCYEPNVEQLHIDGNKSLIYSMIHYELEKPAKKFKTQGRVAYLHNPGFIARKADPLKKPPRFARLDPQKDKKNKRLNDGNDFTHVFKVKGPRSKPRVYNGGITAKITCQVAPTGNCSLARAVLERKKPEEPTTQGEDWEVVNTYFNQSPIYLQAGQALHANLPTPGKWRVRLEGATDPTMEFDLDIHFTREKGWPDPGQKGYKVSSMRFWRMLKKYSQPGMERVDAGDIMNKNGWKTRYDTIVVTNRVYKDLGAKLRNWVVHYDGNLVLTDKAIRMLDTMGVVDGGVGSSAAYAGYINFATQDDDETYDDPLARKIDQPGAAEGGQGQLGIDDDDENHRHQTYEPVPLGYAIQNPQGRDANNSPVWFVNDAALKNSKGKSRAVGTTFNRNNVSLGEIKLGRGRIRFFGAVLPDPSQAFDHPYGLSNYALTYSGYQLLENLLGYEK